MHLSKSRSAGQRFIERLGTWLRIPVRPCDGTNRLHRDDTLRVVTTALGEPEAQLIRQRLTDAEISSVSRRVNGGPEFGDAGTRYVYVPARELERAQDVLGSSS